MSVREFFAAQLVPKLASSVVRSADILMLLMNLTDMKGMYMTN